MNNNNTVFNFSMGNGVSVNPQVHSYTDLNQKLPAGRVQEQPTQAKTINQKEPFVSVKPDTVIGIDDKEMIKTVTQTRVETNQHPSENRQSHLVENLKTLKEENVTEVSSEELPLILRDFPRDKAKNFTEYVLSRPVTFAHKCEDWMAGCSALAILCGTIAVVSLGYPEYIRSNEKVALGFVCAMGVCLAGTVLSGVAGGISEYFDDRKKRMLQEVKAYYRD